MVDEPKVKWFNYVSVTTIVFAVFATLSTFKGGQSSTKTVLNQLNTANAWRIGSSIGGIWRRIENSLADARAHIAFGCWLPTLTTRKAWTTTDWFRSLNWPRRPRPSCERRPLPGGSRKGCFRSGSGTTACRGRRGWLISQHPVPSDYGMRVRIRQRHGRHLRTANPLHPGNRGGHGHDPKKPVRWCPQPIQAAFF